MARIGIVQGRLVPPVRGIQAFPRDSWREEFAHGKQAGVDFIEWIVDEYGFDVNPLLSDGGVAEMKALVAQSGVAVDSVCADCFMDWPLLKCDPARHAELLALYDRIIGQLVKLGAKSLVLPFVDASAITPEEEPAFIRLVNERLLPVAEKAGIELHLETSLDPAGVKRVLAQIPHKLFFINYDSGNSASLGYAPKDEFAAYGPRIGSFHIKDRKLGSTTVPLGTGNTDFAALKQCLREGGYNRNYVLQVARGEPGQEIDWAKQNRRWAETHMLAG